MDMEKHLSTGLHAGRPPTSLGVCEKDGVCFSYLRSQLKKGYFPVQSLATTFLTASESTLLWNLVRNDSVFVLFEGLGIS